MPVPKWWLTHVILVGLLLLAGSVDGQACTADGRCDTHERCSVWKEEGECLRSNHYMEEHCPGSCAKAEPEQGVADAENGCEDAHPRCAIWARLGECDKNLEMEQYCAKSCETCETAASLQGLCRDRHAHCEFWASVGECSSNPGYMHVGCALSCGTCGTSDTTVGRRQTPNMKKETSIGKVDGGVQDNAILQATRNFGKLQQATGTSRAQTLDVIQKSIEYMATPEVQSLSGPFKAACRNVHALCSFWATVGECETNQGYMKLNCAPACGSCELIDINKRCPPLPEDVKPALGPGALNAMFERIVATAPGNITDLAQKRKLADFLNGMPEYTVHVLSRPNDGPVTEISLEKDKELPPWLITFDNFVSDDECDQLIALGHKYEYKRSEDVGEVNLDGTTNGVRSQGRTSENAWCSTHSGCRDGQLPQLIHERIAKVLGIPAKNSEDFQILRYEIGQFYQVHHDYIEKQTERQCGPRILTFFIYLSDLPEGGGGGTDFPKLGLTIQPKKGSAVLWPSVYNSDPRRMDKRFDHQALPVITGTKFAMNGWIHNFDYVGPQARSCT